ncbi:O-antigen ligase family protein [Streptomyces sp. RFCAC02]|uniref:O-antigen ligase family protein n=1 Tax=Streptomyces sp. RFCAC02 TaxID=2499143 RepID=UPI001020A802|nr:O-antigen ligase family protein [Streptomyces sp. RFCAC02]
MTALLAPVAARTVAHRRIVPLLATVLLLALPADRWGLGAGRAGPADLASVVLVGVCGAVLLRGERPALGRAAVAVLGAPAVVFALVTIAARDPEAALPGALRLLQTFVLVPLAVVVLVRDARDVRLVAGALVVLALVQGAVGTWQYASGSGASYMGRTVRAVGTYGPQHVMTMATVVGFGIVAALACALAPPPRAPRWWRPAALGCAVLLGVPLAVSFSRGAWLATAVAVLAVAVPAALLGGRRARRVLLALLAACALLGGGAAFASGMVGERLGSIGEVTGTPDQSVVDRYAMWDAALGMWATDPWTGVGPKGFAALRDGHASIALSGGSDTGGAGHGFVRQELLSPHNMYLMVLAEQGLLGATVLVGGWAALVALGAAALRRRRADAAGLLAAGLLAWQLVAFLYGDIGGPTTVLTGIAFGLAARWVVPAPAGDGAGGARP